MEACWQRPELMSVARAPSPARIFKAAKSEQPFSFAQDAERRWAGRRFAVPHPTPNACHSEPASAREESAVSSRIRRFAQ